MRHLSLYSFPRSPIVSLGMLAFAVLLTLASITPAKAQQVSNPPPQDRALAILQKMTLDDKVNMLHGELNNFFGFYNAPIDSLGIPALKMADGPAGIRIGDPNVNSQKATQLPAPTALAATWDPNLAYQYGNIIGTEAHITGHNTSLGPVLDTARVPQWGRIAEGFGEDPLLTGQRGVDDPRKHPWRNVVADHLSPRPSLAPLILNSVCGP